MYMKLLKFKILVKKCIKICTDKIKYESKDDECTIEEINSIILPEMMKLKKINKTTNLPPIDERYINSYACAFKLWGWNLKKPSTLFRILAKINDEYKRL